MEATKLGMNGEKAADIQGAKGPVFATAIVAGVMAAKRTSELIPFCHPVILDSCDISIGPQRDNQQYQEQIQGSIRYYRYRLQS
jgi:molybdenum cofactor biosynthesis enzyme